MEFEWMKRQEKIRNIPGIVDLFAARKEWDTYFEEMRVFLRSPIDALPPHMPSTDITALSAQYPQAAAFMDALEFSKDPNEAKSAAGDAALAKILEGADPATAIQEMVVEWKHLSGIA